MTVLHESGARIDTWRLRQYTNQPSKGSTQQAVLHFTEHKNPINDVAAANGRCSCHRERARAAPAAAGNAPITRQRTGLTTEA
ncbi:MAG: hypothetical protein RMM58_08720 [Chloroflexota bacterium]|nr:hypothetical protein [Dehalococcoidia bacterium]MDW8253947.1 hypothetical protein [Chloroflexota bacterium]